MKWIDGLLQVVNDAQIRKHPTSFATHQSAQSLRSTFMQEMIGNLIGRRSGYIAVKAETRARELSILMINKTIYVQHDLFVRHCTL